MKELSIKNKIKIAQIYVNNLRDELHTLVLAKQDLEQKIKDIEAEISFNVYRIEKLKETT